MSNGLGETQIFVVRIWVEPQERDSAEPLYRGSVEHVASREIRHFKSFEALGQVITRSMADIAARRGD